MTNRLSLALCALAAFCPSCSTPTETDDPTPGRTSAARAGTGSDRTETPAGTATAAQPAESSGADIPGAPATVDRIVVHYGPSGDTNGDDAVTVEIRDPGTVAHWLTTLAAIPAQPERGVRMIRFMPNTPEHRVEFYAGDNLRMFHRLKGNQLDVAEHDGWAFYSGEDKDFSALVAAVLPGE